MLHTGGIICDESLLSSFWFSRHDSNYTKQNIHGSTQNTPGGIHHSSMIFQPIVRRLPVRHEPGRSRKHACRNFRQSGPAIRRTARLRNDVEIQSGILVVRKYSTNCTTHMMLVLQQAQRRFSKTLLCTDASCPDMSTALGIQIGMSDSAVRSSYSYLSRY